MTEIRPIAPTDADAWRELFRAYGVFYETRFDDDVLDGVWGWLLDPAHEVSAIVADDGGELVGFARAVSDGVAFAYLADVFVDPAHRGAGLGHRLVTTMIDEGPGADFRWTLFTGDAHGLYRQHGFAEPDATAMVRPPRQG